MSEHTGQVAVITGGTQGLGETTARLFAARGAAGLVICGRNAERGAAVAAELSDIGCRTVYVQADLASLDDCRRIVAGADAAFGRVDVLANIAAITDRGTILDTSPEQFERMMAINLRAPFFLMQDAARIMRRERIAGTIVNILSMSAHGGQPFLSAYSTSKGALLTLTRNTAYALMPDHIRVNGLAIGWMDTPGEHAIQTGFHGAAADWLERVEREQPFGRLIKTDEVARAISYLGGAESGLMTGAILDFDQSVLGACDSAAHPVGRLADPG